MEPLDDLVDAVDDFRTFITRTPKDLGNHLKFLSQLQGTLITFICIYTIVFGGLHFLGLRDYYRRRTRLIRDEITVTIDEKEGGEAKYLLSFITSREYARATTAITTIHLIGQVFPGRIHDVGLCKAGEKYKIFAPLCREKIVVMEDLNLDPLIGIVIKTNQEGSDPIWFCRQLIIRNVDTNDAWIFPIKNKVEIGFSRCMEALEAPKLLTLHSCFVRRLRQEWRHGEHSIFGLYYWTPICAYSMAQRLVVTIGTHLILMSFTMISLCMVLPERETVADRTTEFTDKEKVTHGGYGVTRFGWSLEGSSHFSIWVNCILFSALFAGFITTMLAHVIIMHFRQREKYEGGFSEMDYVVGTALRKCSQATRDRLEKLQKNGGNSEELNNGDKDEYSGEQSTKSFLQTTSGTFIDEGHLSRELLSEPLLPAHLGPSNTTHQPLSHAEERAYQRYLFIGGKNLNDPQYSHIMERTAAQSTAHLELEHHHIHGRRKSRYVSHRSKSKSKSPRNHKSRSKSRVRRNRSDLSRISDFVQQHRDRDIQALKPIPVEPNTKQQHFYVPEITFPTYKTGIRSKTLPTETGGDELNNASSNPNQNQEAEKWWTEDSNLVPGEKDPNKFKRSFFKPCIAWIMFIGLLSVSLLGFLIFSNIGPHASIHPQLFAMIFVTTFLLGLLILTFVFEIVKIVFISLYYARTDQKLFQKIIERGVLPKNVGFQYKS